MTLLLLLDLFRGPGRRPLTGPLNVSIPLPVHYCGRADVRARVAWSGPSADACIRSRPWHGGPEESSQSSPRCTPPCCPIPYNHPLHNLSMRAPGRNNHLLAPTPALDYDFCTLGKLYKDPPSSSFPVPASAPSPAASTSSSIST